MFGYNLIRSDFCTGLENYLQLVRASGLIRYVFVDGSFVSAKVVPSDVDAVIELPVPAAVAAAKPALMQLLNQTFVKSVYHVHAFSVTFDSTDSWVAFFQRLKTHDLAVKKLPKNFQKGILRLPVA